MERLFGDDVPPDGGAAPPSAAPPDRDAAAGRTPLATRMRPRELSDFVGQERLLAEDSALRRAIEQGHPHSMILHGPPGSGKTTLARIIAGHSGWILEEESAVAAGRAEVRAVIERARERLRRGVGTIFFLDEIHRFNKAQQDALLPAVEEGIVTLIGATTENPYFEVNSALLSRARVYELDALGPDEVHVLLGRALAVGECGPGREADAEALEFLAARSEGDARMALNALELACETAGDGVRVDLGHAEQALQRRALRYDARGDQHYDTISAWIKATRGSDPDASLYYLAVMLEAGEDPRFIARRMIVLASEDIGGADPSALSVAVAAADAVEHVGLPECQFALAQAAIHLSLAPKSDAAKRGVFAAREFVREHGAEVPPPPLRSGSRNDGGYDNPHRHPGHFSSQELMPPSAVGERFYSPDDAEAGFRERLEAILRARRG